MSEQFRFVAQRRRLIAPHELAIRPPAAEPGAGCGIPPASLKGYHATARGQNCTMRAPARRARTCTVEGCPRAAAWSGSARPPGCHTTPRSKIAKDHSEPMIVWTLYGHKTGPDNQK